jgi:hypothetical protein
MTMLCMQGIDSEPEASAQLEKDSDQHKRTRIKDSDYHDDAVHTDQHTNGAFQTVNQKIISCILNSHAPCFKISASRLPRHEHSAWNLPVENGKKFHWNPPVDNGRGRPLQRE